MYNPERILFDGDLDPVSENTGLGSVADPDPGSGAFLTPESRTVKNLGSGSGMNNPDHISESLETIFWVKIVKFFYADPGWIKFGSGMEKIRIRDGKNSDPGSRMKKIGSRIRHGKNSDPGWKKYGSGMEKFGSGIRDEKKFRSGIGDGKNSDPEWKKFGSGM
jgi:hypothetical protein